MAIKKIKIAGTSYDINDSRSVVIGDNAYNLVALTTAQYNALATKDPQTLYVITDGDSGGGSVVSWGTVSNYTVPLTVNGVTKTVCLNGYSAGEGGGVVLVTEVTWSELKTLRDGDGLTAGAFYRITDFVTTTTYAESQSAGHHFDIIVQAIGTGALNEEALATWNASDTYFTNSALNAWKVWYCLDNDTTRFNWADSTNGKGVVYRLIDEFGNDVPYDFKNIQFKRYKVTPKTAYSTNLSELSGLYIGSPSTYSSETVSTCFDIDSSDYNWYFTFSDLASDLVTPTDLSLEEAKCRENHIGVCSYQNNSEIQKLNNVVMMCGTAVDNFLSALGTYNAVTYKCHNNVIREDCFSTTVFGQIRENDIDTNFYYNIIVGVFRQNIVGHFTQRSLIFSFTECSTNTIGGYFSSNVIKIRAFNSSIFDGTVSGNNIYANQWIGNTISNNFTDNTISVSGAVSYNRFSASVSGNTIEASAIQGNAFDGIFSNNTANTLGNNIFLGSFTNNTLSSMFVGNRVHGQIRYNTFSPQFVYCTFDGIFDYLEVPTQTGSFGACDIRGMIRGASSSHISLDNSNFYLSSTSGVSRRVTIEGDPNGNIIATWKNGASIVGVMKASGGSTWADITIGGGDENVIEAITFNGTTATITNKTAAITASIPPEVTESTVSGWGFTKNTGTYSKPSGGIPATDLASAVQTSLGKADTALQSYTETDPVFTASAAHGISSTDISNWNSKQSAITISSSEPTSSQGSNGDIWIVV